MPSLSPSNAPVSAATPPSRPRVRRQLRAAPEARERRRRFVRYAVLAISGLLMINALFGEKGYLATIQAQQQNDEVAGRLSALRAENARLAEEARRLREDPLALEEAAREGLGLIRPGEIVITIRDRQKD